MNIFQEVTCACCGFALKECHALAGSFYCSLECVELATFEIENAQDDAQEVEAANMADWAEECGRLRAIGH